ncbi:hypothetical protein FA13DRAFT_1720119 [Coprinellus micaceus]|uniref:Uncharacterized protein n=1 Tax=Coprinellus micaceus TaxID=71717 RepID=A0A4Y7SAQ0_COPMI|nr:hypothetical protein FA13DRAFT_1720119 [Coprinellus micaceus]
MAEQQPTPNTSDNTNEVESSSWSGIGGVTAERIEDRDGTKVAEFRIFGLDGEHWKSFDLYWDPSGEVKMCGPPMVLPTGVVGIRYACTAEGVEGLHIIHSSLPGCGGDTPDAGPGRGQNAGCGTARTSPSWQSMHIPILEDSASIRTQLDRWETLYDRFKQAGDLNDISEAISTLREVVEKTPEWDVNLPARLNNLGNSFARRFEHTGNPSDLAEAIIISLKTALSTSRLRGTQTYPACSEPGELVPLIHIPEDPCFDLTPGDTQIYLAGARASTAMLMNLGNSYLRQFERTGNLGDIAESISLKTRAVDLTPEGHAALPGRLANLGTSYLCQFEQTGNLGDVAESISLKTRAVDLTPEGQQTTRHALNLGNSYLCQFERTGNLGDIAESISLKTRAVDLTPEGHTDLPGWLMNLGNSYLRQFERTGNLGDIAESISLKTRAVDLTPEGHTDLPGWLMNLGNSYLRQFERTGNLGDIAESISLKTRAVDLTPEGHAIYRHAHEPGELTRAVDLTPEGHTDLPGWLMNLGNSYLLYLAGSRIGASYFCRFHRTGNLLDINEAVSVQFRAVHLTPAGHADRPSRLSNLGICFSSRFELTHDASDLSQAISDIPNRLTSPHPTSIPAHEFEHLASSLLAASALWRFGTVGLAPEGHPLLPRWLTGLGIAYMQRFSRTSDSNDVTEGSTTWTKLRVSPEMHASLPSICCPGIRLVPILLVKR